MMWSAHSVFKSIAIWESSATVSATNLAPPLTINNFFGTDLRISSKYDSGRVLTAPTRKVQPEFQDLNAQFLRKLMTQSTTANQTWQLKPRVRDAFSEIVVKHLRVAVYD